MSIEAMKQALAVLEEIADEVFSPYDNKLGDAILALRAAIEQPRQWQRLTHQEIKDIEAEKFWDYYTSIDFARLIEAKLREKNG